MRIIVSVLFIVIVLNGCFSTKRVVTQTKEFPSWYSNPQKSTSSVLYAVGEGENKRVAINKALNEIVATLRVTVSSEFTSKTQVSKGDRESYQVTSSNTIKSQVEKIKINNYEVSNEKDFGFEKYLVEVKIEKRKFFLGLAQELDSTFSRMQKRVKKPNAIEQLGMYQKDKDALENMNNTLSVMRALDPAFNDAAYIEKILEVKNRHTNLLSQISFSLHPNKDANNLRASFSKGLSDAQHHLRNGSGSKHFKVYISSRTNRAKSYGFDLARSSILVNVKDHRGTVIGSNKLNLIGQSTQGYLIARENVAIKLNVMIQKEGIAKIIGLNL